MILYRLACTSHHRFESWFRDSLAFDEQVERGLLACPVCGDVGVTKTIMAPAVVGGAARRDLAVVPAPPPPRDGALLDARQRAIRAALHAVRTKILAEGQDVGARFPDEARQMHEGAIPARPIHGLATPEEARGLIDDGIVVLPLPVLPEELN